MARPKKENLDYLPMDTDFFKNKMVKVLLSRFGSVGVVVYLYIICEICGKKGYFLEEDEDFTFIAAQDIGIQKEEIDKIIVFLIERKLLVRIKVNNGAVVITSRGVQKRYQEVFKLCRRNVSVSREIWILDEDETADFIVAVGDYAEIKGINTEETDVNTEKTDVNTEKTAEIKEKKIKRNKTKKKIAAKNSDLIVSPEQTDPFFEDVDIDREFRDFLRNREINGVLNTEIAVKRLITKLGKYPKEVVIESINCSIENNWRGVFPDNVVKKQRRKSSCAEDPFKAALKQIDGGDYDIK